jgi:hypothetical protein
MCFSGCGKGRRIMSTGLRLAQRLSIAQQRALHCKAPEQKKGWHSPLAIPHLLNQRFHVIEIALQSSSSGRI